MSDDLFDDEYDPLAPPGGGPAPEPETEELGVGGFEGGGVVKVWFDDGRLSNVRVSTTWYDQLAEGRTLAMAFEEAFLRASATILEEDDTHIDPTRLQLDLPPCTPEAVDAYAAMMHDHAARWRAAIEAAPGNEPQPEPAVGEHTGAVVVLNQAGHPARVMFDEEWLEDAQVGPICSAVLGATHKAYQGFVPPTDHTQQALERFRLEHEVLLAGFRRLLDPRREEHA
ncbi:hypothetical protein [uncultured Tessaracoccus sp.]|uniref:hypothetical protein n=1 Tax=uncultured Tessaracoccus sp. TaxID=905023 RepID=UPI0025F77430|nr:hypothetical protein [uncultured Tessaracoccus sp.]